MYIIDIHKFLFVERYVEISLKSSYGNFDKLAAK